MGASFNFSKGVGPFFGGLGMFGSISAGDDTAGEGGKGVIVVVPAAGFDEYLFIIYK
jgi:hypothetical protein